MGKILRYVLRDCDLFADRVDKIGQIEEISIPVPEVKVDEIRNAGMIMPIEVHMGYEKPEMSFKGPVFDPQLIKLFGLKPGVLKEYMATGAYVDEDGTVHSAVCFLRAFMKKVDPGSWKPGDKGETGHELSVREYNLEMDGNPLIKVTPFDIEIGGESQYAEIRRALLTA